MQKFTNIHPANDCNIAKAAKIIQSGDIVGVPTETVYGLGADATNNSAIAKIYEAKQRPSFDPLIVHVASIEQAWGLTENVPEAARQLAEAFWPGPLTLILKRKPASTLEQDKTKQKYISELVSAGLSTVAIRMPAHPVARKLIEKAGVPIAAPSANPFSYTSPTTAEHVAQGLGEKIEFILDGGACATGVESTVVLPADSATRRSIILRAGGLEKEKIEKIIGKVDIAVSTSNPNETDNKQASISPGMSKRHYATATPLYLVDTLAQALDKAANMGGLKIGLLGYNQQPENHNIFAAAELLSLSGDLAQAAANLFAAMHRLDDIGLDAIIAVRVPKRGLGLAINDRLNRAQAPKG